MSDGNPYRVVYTEATHEDLREHADLIARDSLAASERWLDGITDLLDSLSELPTRFAIACEREHEGLVLRQVVYRSHRALYTVHEDLRLVIVHRVLHSARDRWRR